MVLNKNKQINVSTEMDGSEVIIQNKENLKKS